MPLPNVQRRQRQAERWTALTLEEQIATVRTHLAKAGHEDGAAPSAAFWRNRLNYLTGAQERSHDPAGLMTE